MKYFKYIINIWLITLLDLILIISLFIAPYYKLYGTYFYILITLIFIGVTIGLLYILYVCLRKKRLFSVNKKYKLFFLGFLVIMIVVTCQIHSLYLKHYVIPETLYCNYYDEYDYKIYISEDGCQKLSILEKELNNTGNLEFLSYKVGNNTYERYYNGRNIIKTIEYIDNMLVSNIDVSFDKVKVETQYFYEEKQFRQERTLTYYIDNQSIITQTGLYSSLFSINDDGAHINYVTKSMSEYTILKSDEELRQIFNNKYLKDHSLKEFTPESYVTYLQTLIMNTKEDVHHQILQLQPIGRNAYISNVDGEAAEPINGIQMGYYQDYFKVLRTVKKVGNTQFNEDYWYNHNGELYNADKYFNITYDWNFKYNIDGTLKYIDISCGKNTIIRHLVTNENHVKKVETFNLLNKRRSSEDFRNECSWTSSDIRPGEEQYKRILKNEIMDYYFLPFGFEFLQQVKFLNHVRHILLIKNYLVVIIRILIHRLYITHNFNGNDNESVYIYTY